MTGPMQETADGIGASEPKPQVQSEEQAVDAKYFHFSVRKKSSIANFAYTILFFNAIIN